MIEGGFESFVQHFDNGLDIYFSAGDSEAHEVHGDITRKYDIVSPPSNKSLFGLPMTDESPAANYGFDVTPRHLVTGLITERGVCEANENSICALFP